MSCDTLNNNLTLLFPFFWGGGRENSPKREDQRDALSREEIDTNTTSSKEASTYTYITDSANNLDSSSDLCKKEFTHNFSSLFFGGDGRELSPKRRPFKTLSREEIDTHCIDCDGVSLLRNHHP